MWFCVLGTASGAAGSSLHACNNGWVEGYFGLPHKEDSSVWDVLTLFIKEECGVLHSV